MQPQPPFRLPLVVREGIALVQLAVIWLLIACTAITVIGVAWAIGYSILT
jgi:hypothetical protein